MKFLCILSILVFSSFVLAPEELTSEIVNPVASQDVGTVSSSNASAGSDASLSALPNDSKNASSDVDTDFNFGEVSNEASSFSVNIGGGLYVGITPFFSDLKNIGELKPSSMLWANIHLDAQAPLTHAYISLALNDQTLPFNLGNKYATTKTNKIPRLIDEAFLQVSLSALYFSAGAKRITWGRADALSVLDVINPHDMTERLFPDNPDKMSVPLLHFFAYTPRDIKLEAVFLPMFTPHLLAIEGKWESEGMKQLKNTAFAQTFAKQTTQTEKHRVMQNVFKNETDKFKFAQSGARISTTIANTHDIALQYFYGYSKMPIVHYDGVSAIAEYLPTHHIGMDYGTAIGMVNLKLEACANIVGKQRMKESNFEWNADFSSSLPHGLKANLVFKETIWTYILEEDANASYALFRKNRQTETISLFSLSQTILRGAVEWRIAVMMGLEDVDCALLPSLHALFGTIIFDAQLGFFLGRNHSGTFSQYHKNSYLRLKLGYEF